MSALSLFLSGGTFALCATSLLAGPNANGPSARILHQHTLPKLSLMEFGYTQAELDAAQPNGLVVSDRPGFGSGLERVYGNVYIGVTDRGPNIDHFPVDANCAPTSSRADGKTFPLPVTGQFVVLMSPVSEYPAGNRQRDLELSAMAWLADDQLLFLERSDEASRGGVRLILVDLSMATEVSHLAGAQTLDLEDVNRGPSSLGITTAVTTVAFEEFENNATRFFPTYELEGLAVLNKNEVAIINDNDFGIAGVVDAPTQLWVLRLADQLP